MYSILYMDKSSILSNCANILNNMNSLALNHIETLGDRVAFVLSTYEGNQTSAAKAIGVTRGAVSQWKLGDVKRIRPENLFPLARITGYSAEWIATGTGPMKPTSQLSTEEKNLIELFRRANDEEKRMIIGVAHMAASGGKI